jgi:hypothetical protein
LRAIDIPLRRMDSAGEGLPRALIDSAGLLHIFSEKE